MSTPVQVSVEIPVSPHALAEWVVSLASRGVQIYITGTLYDKLADVFEELGIRVEPVEHPEGDEYVLLKPAGVQVVVEYYRGGERVASRRVPLSKFVEALHALKERRGRAEKPRILRVVIPDELLAALRGDEAGGGDGA